MPLDELKVQQKLRNNQEEMNIKEVFQMLFYLSHIFPLSYPYIAFIHLQCRRWIFRGLLSTLEIQTRLIVVLEYH